MPKSSYPTINTPQQSSLLSTPILTNTSTNYINQHDGLMEKPLIRDSSQKIPRKFFQEIGDDYNFEIILAAPMPTDSHIRPSMDIEPIEEIDDDDVNMVPSTARRRGSPLGSKKKPFVPKIGECSNKFLALTDQEGMACSTPHFVSQ